MMTLPGMRDRTILVNSMSKTYAVTGWRVGWVLARPDLTDSIRKVHDFLTVGAAAPLQQAGALALAMPDEYYTNLSRDYGERRDTMLEVLEGAGFRPFRPSGAYYIMADISGFGYADDMQFDAAPDRRRRGCGGAGIEFLRNSAGRGAIDPLLLLQKI